MTCICVLGMHRSGTSCLTGIMQSFGVELGDVFTENPFNKRGNRENGRIVFLNDAVLATNGAAWNQPAVVTRWTQDECRERDAIVAELAGRGSDYWGFKDPRTLFTLPFWSEVIDKPLFIGTFRHPHRVALSLNQRDGFPLEQGWALWHAYNTRLLELAGQYDFPLIDFDLPAAAYLEDAIGKLLQLGLNPDKAERAKEFFDSGLRNQAASDVQGIELPSHVAALYEELRSTYKRSCA